MAFDVSVIPEVDSILKNYLIDLEHRISEAFRVGEFETINISEINRELDKPRDGDVINADGVNYNPGSGKGLYYFDGTTYTKL